jgi:splicing factor 4
MMRKRAEVERLQARGKNKYEYDSDEEFDGGTWEHKAREKEMIATRERADSLTEAAKGKHHIGDFLPPEELKNFLEKVCFLKCFRYFFKPIFYFINFYCYFC